MQENHLSQRIEQLEQELKRMQERLLHLEQKKEASEGESLLNVTKSEPQPEPVVLREMPPPLSQVEKDIEPITPKEVTKEAYALPTKTNEWDEVTAQVFRAEASPKLDKERKLPNAELVMGQVWTVRIGVLLMLTGFVFLGNYAWENYVSQMNAMPRLLILMALAISAVAAGEVMRHKPRLGTFGEVISAGGLAAVYYCAYGAHHIGRLRIIESPLMGASLLTITGLTIMAYGVWRRAATMCSIALLLSFYGCSIQPMEWSAMLSGLIVAMVGAWLCVRMQWKSMGYMGLLGAYAAFILWQGMVNEAPAFSVASWFLCCYWALYNFVILHPKNPWSEKESALLSALNHGLLAAFLPFDWQTNAWSSQAWLVHALLGAVVLLQWAYLEKRRGIGKLSEVHLFQGLTLITLASVLKFSGHELFNVLAVKGLFLLAWDQKNRRSLVEWCGLGIVLLSTIVAMAEIVQCLSISKWNWLMYSTLMLANLQVGRVANQSLETYIALARFFSRWNIAIGAVLALALGVFCVHQTPDGAVGMLVLALAYTGVGRLLGSRVRLAEILPLILFAAIVSELRLIWQSGSISALSLGLGAALSLGLALAQPQQIELRKKVEFHTLMRLCLALVGWLVVGVFADRIKPLGEWTPCMMALLLIAIQLLCERRKWMLMAVVTPFFSVLVIYLMGYDGAPAVLADYVTYSLILVFGAWLSYSKLGARLAVIPAIPAITGVFGLFSLLALARYGTLGMLLLVLVLAASPLLRLPLWKGIICVAAAMSFFRYVEHGNGIEALAYPTLVYLALAYRARRLRLPSVMWSKAVAVAITLALTWNLFRLEILTGNGYEWAILCSLLAILSLAISFAIREAVLRGIMLLFLLACLGSILTSVWQLGTVMRIVSFLVTGMLFLVLGYIYNKHPEWFGRDQATEP